jgi:hypothetical protein
MIDSDANTSLSKTAKQVERRSFIKYLLSIFTGGVLIDWKWESTSGKGKTFNRHQHMEKINHYGYYVFLGLGDFWQVEHPSPERETFVAPSPLTSQWTSTWTLSVWKERIEQWSRLGTNTLFIYLMGDRLPYQSEKFSDCVETEHPNVKSDFFQDVIDFALERNIQLVAVFTTT